MADHHGDSSAEEQTEEKNMDIVEEMAKTCEMEEVATTKKPAKKRAASGVDHKKLTPPKGFLTHEQAKAEAQRIGLKSAVMDSISMEDFPRLAKIAGLDLDRFQKLVERQEKANQARETVKQKKTRETKEKKEQEKKETQEKKKAEKEKEKQAAKAKAPVEQEQKSTKKVAYKSFRRTQT